MSQDPGPHRPGARSGTGNAEWIAALSATPPDAGRVNELRSLIRRRLRAALAGRGIDDDTLEDFTQEATLRVLDRLGSFRGDSRFSTWVHAIAVRVAFSELRRRRTPTRPLEELVAAAGTSPTDPGLAPESQELVGALRRAIDEALTERQRTMILGELAGASTESLAEQLGIRRNALYKLYYDARRKLREALISAGFTEEDVRDHLERASKKQGRRP